MPAEENEPLRRIRVMFGDSPAQRRFCLSVLIAQRDTNNTLTNIEGWREWLIKNGHKNGYKVLKRIADLQGVVEIKICYFDVSIAIGGAFDWDVLQPRILDIIRQELFDEQDFSRIELQDRTTGIA